MADVVHEEDVEMHEKNDRQTLTPSENPSADKLPRRPSLNQKQAERQEPANEDNAQVEDGKFRHFVKETKNMSRKVATNAKFFFHHKNKVDKRNYYCGYTCHGWATMIIYYLLFYAFLIGFWVGLYFLAYYIIPFPQQASLWANPTTPASQSINLNPAGN